MAGLYSLTGSRLTLANAVVTLTWVNPAAAPNKDLLFRRFWVGQAGTATGQQAVQLNTQGTAFPTVVSATPAKLSNIDGASVITGNTNGAAGTSGVNASAEGGGTKTIVWADSFSVINGWLVVFTPDEVLEAGAGSASGVGMHFPVAATTLANWTFGCTWGED